MRYKLTLEYNGSLFAGWQKQPGISTVQQTVETALFHLTQEDTPIYGAGRTDQGVHATGQVAHIDLLRPFSLDSLRRGLNFYLKDQGVIIRQVCEVAPDFHARFSAQFRAYLYKILNRPSPPVLDEGRVWWVHRPLDVEAMRVGAGLLEGHHDFSTFRSKDCGSDRTWRTLDVLTISREGEHILFYIRARAFLHQQVRIMIGTLKLIGEGKLPPEVISDMFASQNRAKAGPTAPPEGLYLVEVGY